MASKIGNAVKMYSIGGYHSDKEKAMENEEGYEEYKPDNVNAPNHYMLDGLDIEAIDVIKAVTTPAGFMAYCRGNELKYLIRADRKGGVEDLEKARKYLDWEIETYRDYFGE